MGANLRDRVQTAVATRDGGGEVEQRPKTLAEQIEAKKDVFQAALPDGAEARHLIRDAMALLRQQPKLAQCDINTVLGGLMTFAQLGLRPGVLGQGWLIPFKKRVKDGNRWVEVWEAQVVIGYKGYAELIHRTGSALTMVARRVHANDHFELEYGIDDRLVHRPAMTGPRGEVTGYYSVIKFTTGGYVFWYMTKAECEEWRDKYAMARKQVWENGKKTDRFEIVGPWRDEFDSMADKTVFLRASNLAPKTTQLARATAIDGAVRRDLGEPDEMFFAKRPEPFSDSDYIDGEVAGDPADDPAAPSAEVIPNADDDPEGWHKAGHPRRAQDGSISRTDYAPDWCQICPPADPPAK